MVRVLWILLALTACSPGSVDPDRDTLSASLSVTGVRKTPVTDASGSITALLVDAEVVNTAFFPIDRPFRMTWTLREGSRTVSTASTVFGAGLGAGARQAIHLRLAFPARQSVEGWTDAVTFDLLDL